MKKKHMREQIREMRHALQVEALVIDEKDAHIESLKRGTPPDVLPAADRIINNLLDLLEPTGIRLPPELRDNLIAYKVIRQHQKEAR